MVDRDFYKRLISNIEKRIQLLQDKKAGADLYDYERKLLIEQLIQRIQDAEKALQDNFWEYTQDMMKGR
jgi:hypothetical protein